MKGNNFIRTNLPNISLYPHIRPFKVLDLDESKTVDKKLFICDACINTVRKVLDMRETLKKNMLSVQHQETQKRVILHSVSPAAKKLKDITNVLPRSKASKRSLFVNSPAREKEINQSASKQTDHQYFSSTKQNFTVKEIYHMHHKKIIQNIDIE